MPYYIHRAIGMVVLPVFGTPKPIARAPTCADIIRTPSPNYCRAFAYGVMQAIIQGRPKGREVIGKKYTLITTTITTQVSIQFVPLKTCITNDVRMRLPSGARIKRDNISNDTAGNWEWGTRARRAGSHILQKALPLLGKGRHRGSNNGYYWADKWRSWTSWRWTRWRGTRTRRARPKRR